MSVHQLSKCERSVVRDYIRLGSLVAVAEARNRSVKTVETQVRIARKKCGGVSLVQLAVLVDRVSSVDIPTPAPFIPSTEPRFAAPSRSNA